MKKNKRVLGIVAAKEQSERFPGKNLEIVDNMPLFMHPVTACLKSKLITDFILSTNFIDYTPYKSTSGNFINHIRRFGKCDTNDSIANVWKSVYRSLVPEYDYIVGVLANTIGHTSEDIDKALELIQSKNLQEVRSFGHDGIENGIIVLTRDRLLNGITNVKGNPPISTYIGAIITNGKEIHYKEDLV